MAPVLRTQGEIDQIRAAGSVVSAALQQATTLCSVGTRTHLIEEVIRDTIADAGAEPLFLNYPSKSNAPGFPGTACVSVNDAVIHGVPGDDELAYGDVVSVDCGVRLDGWCADSATTFIVGTASPSHDRLIASTQELLNRAIDQIRPGIRWSTIASDLDHYAAEAGFGVVAEYVGHGIGRQLHEAPQAPAVMTRSLEGRGDFTLQPGMVIAVEPILVAIDEACAERAREMGRAERVNTVIDQDGWTVRTESGAVACHCEHTIAVTRSGSDVLTAWNESALHVDESEAARG